MIWVSNLIPQKNQKNVDVNVDLTIELNADHTLDPRDVSLYINNTLVVPTIYRVDNGETAETLKIVLFTKRRIKYGTGHRYGEESLRYGKRDIFPSMLQFESRYVCRVVVNDRDEYFEDSFAFETEAGIFKNEKPADYYYSDRAQAIANYFPEWSKSRYDRNSVLQQIVNPFGEALEEIQRKIALQHRGCFVQTANLNELSNVSKVELNKDYVFQSIVGQDGEAFFIQPEIVGIKDLTRYDLTVSQMNSINDLYYNSLPTRISTKKMALSSNVIVKSFIPQTEVASLNLELEIVSQIKMIFRGLKTSIEKGSDGVIRIAKCRIFGTSEDGIDQSEEFFLVKDRPLITAKKWRKISHVDFFNTTSCEDLSFDIYYFSKKEVMSSSDKVVDVQDYEVSTYYKQNNIENRTVLQLLAERELELLSVLQKAGELTIKREIELLDIDSKSPVSLIDMTIDPMTTKLYGVDDNFFYIYDRRLPYSNILKKIKGKNGTSDLKIIVEHDEYSLDENNEKEILVKCIQSKAENKVIRYRLSITEPDGNVRYFNEHGDIEKEAATIYVGDFLEESNQFWVILKKAGDHILSLETVYAGGRVETDQKVVTIYCTSAMAKYSLKRIMGDSVPELIDFSGDQKLVIWGSDQTLHEITLNRDGIVIDYLDKVLYTIEDYDYVDIED